MSKRNSCAGSSVERIKKCVGTSLPGAVFRQTTLPLFFLLCVFIHYIHEKKHENIESSGKARRRFNRHEAYLGRQWNFGRHILCHVLLSSNTRTLISTAQFSVRIHKQKWQAGQLLDFKVDLFKYQNFNDSHNPMLL